MSLFHCPLPFWSSNHISTCVQNNYVEVVVPVSACLVSLALLLLPYMSCQWTASDTTGFQHLSDTTDAQSNTGTKVPRYIASNGPRLTSLEGFALLADIFLSLLRGVTAQSVPTIQLLFSGYSLCLVVGRKRIGMRNLNVFARLWLHSTSLYTTQWLCTLAVSQAAVVTEPGGFLYSLVLIRCGTFAILLLLQLTAPRFLANPCRRNHTDPALHPSREQKASCLSRVTFTWVADLVWRAYHQTLEAHDLYDLDLDQKSNVVSPTFRAIAAASLPLLSRLYVFFKHDLLLQGVWAAIMSLMMFAPALLLRLILEYLESPEVLSRDTAWLSTAALLAAGILGGMADCQCEWIGRRISAKLRTIMISEIYAKVLRRKMARTTSEDSEQGPEASSEVASHASDGSILNLMAVDAAKISDIGAHMHLAWMSFPLQITIATYVLYRIIGLSGVAGVLLMIVLLPLNILIAKRQVAAQDQVLKATDARIQHSNELVANIRIIKYCAWEASTSKGALKLRSTELSRLRCRFLWWSLSMTIWYSIPLLITMSTLFFYTIIEKKSLEISVAFPALAVFAVIRMPLDRVSAMISFVLQAHVSLIRVDKFLKEEETAKYHQLSGLENDDIGFDDATLAWSGSGVGLGSAIGDIELANMTAAQSFRLLKLQISFQMGRLNLVCGPSGSGKSSLLLALLGEMEVLHGKVCFAREDSVDGGTTLHQDRNSFSKTTAFCPQEPWILNRTIRANILFGLPFERSRYDLVLHAVALSEDLALLDQGDQTMAGEKGNRLSGGQKQRVSLARALYSRAEQVLLDDCLSAVDSRTAKHIFFQAIKGPLMNHRTCILATHNIQLAVPHCDFAVFLEKGRVKGQGTVTELLSARLIGADIIDGTIEASTCRLGSEYGKMPDPGSFDINSPFSQDLSDNESSQNIDVIEVDPEYEEEKVIGAVGWRAVKTYATSMGAKWYWVIVLSTFAAQQLASLGTNLWIKEWAYEYSINENIRNHEQSSTPSKEVDAKYYLAVYALICLTFVVVSFFRDAITFYGALRASSVIHKRLLNSILYARLTFFDRVPLGQITNRFSKDIETLDQDISPYSISTFQILSSLGMVIVLISIILPAFLIAAVAICLAYYSIANVYINSARDLKRIESVERSPLYQQFGESLTGYVSIRAYNRMASFTLQNHNLIDRYNRPYVLLWASKEWLTFRVACLSSLISSLTGAFVLWYSDSISAGAAGLVLTYSTTFTDNVLWFVQLYAMVQQNFNSVERILEYTDIEQEMAEPSKPAYNLPQEWPTRGIIRFQRYMTRYAAELEPVLKGIDFEALPGERVAIVGRTGAGKSTLALALIRGLEAESGRITIDDVDISSVRLEKLRQAVTVVPQDPTLFNGSLRDNLDPLERYSDDEIFNSLRNVYLLDSLPSTDLDYPFVALSLGQRQLLCIARALLRRSRVLVLDEATASIDHETDSLIQASIRRTVVAGTTVLTIAHRLYTIADYDRVIVLDAGRVVEQGSVVELLARRGPNAHFRLLCEESGDLERIESTQAASNNGMKV